MENFTKEDFNKLKDWQLRDMDWSWFLSEQPQFIEHCNLDRLYGYDWCRILEKQPQLAEYCDWKKLDDYDWSCLLRVQPQFAKYKK